jgi:hypothetical protein
MSIAKRLFKKYNHSSSVCIGLPGNKDPQQFKVRTATAAAAATSQSATPLKQHFGAIDALHLLVTCLTVCMLL